MRRKNYAWMLETLLEDIFDFFHFSEPPYQNEEIAKRAGGLRREVIKFLTEVEEAENEQ